MQRIRFSKLVVPFTLMIFSMLLGMLLGMVAPGCGLLIGNIRPVDEKSDQYGVIDLAKENPSVWTKLTPAQEGANALEPETTATEIPDVAFQSTKTAAVISINSSCRPTVKDSNSSQSDLHNLASQLTYGISEVTQHSEQDLTVQSNPAISTQVQGKMNGNPIALKAVVFKKKTCVYDLLYMAPPTRFDENAQDFERFVSSLRLK